MSKRSIYSIYWSYVLYCIACLEFTWLSYIIRTTQPETDALDESIYLSVYLNFIVNIVGQAQKESNFFQMPDEACRFVYRIDDGL